MNDTFISPEFTAKTMDVFFIRSAIKLALTKALPFFTGVLLDIGCGNMPYRDFLLGESNIQQYIGLDLESSRFYDITPDMTWDGQTIPLSDDSVDCAIATEVFEHCPDLCSTLTEIHRVLKPDGRLFFTTPFLWPFHDVPYDECRLTPYSLFRLLGESGFDRAAIRRLGGWDAAVAQILALYSCRALTAGEKKTEFTRKFRDLIHESMNCELAKIAAKLEFTNVQTSLSDVHNQFAENAISVSICGVAHA